MWVYDHCKKKVTRKTNQGSFTFISNQTSSGNQEFTSLMKYPGRLVLRHNSMWEVLVKTHGSLVTNQYEMVRKSYLDALIKLIKQNSGKVFGYSFHASNIWKPLIVYSRASHHMISDSNLIRNVKLNLGNVVIVSGDGIPNRVQESQVV